MKKLACGLAAVALFGLSAEAVTIDPGVGVAVSPAKITGNVDVDVFSGIVTMDPGPRRRSGRPGSWTWATPSSAIPARRQ